MAYVRDEPGDRELLEAAFAQAPFGMLVLDRDCRYVAVNEALAESNNRPVAGHVGRAVAEVIPETWPMLEPLFARVHAGETVTETWRDLWVQHARATRSARATFIPLWLVAPDGERYVAGSAVVFQDVSAEVRLLRRSDRFRDMGQELADAGSREQVAAAVSRLVREELGAGMVLLAGYDERTGELVTVGEGPDTGLAAPPARIPLSVDSPPSLAFVTGTELVVRSREEHDRRWPHRVQAAAASGVEASATLPLLIEGRPVGVLDVGWPTPREIDEEEMSYLRSTATRVASAVGRLAALEREEEAGRRARALLSVAARLNALVEAEEVATLVASTVIELTGAGEAGLYLVSADGSALVRADRTPAVDPQRRQKYHELAVDGTRTPVTAAVATRRPVWLDSREAWAPFPTVVPDVAAMDWPSIAALPLDVGQDDGEPGTAFGALYAHYRGPRRLLEEDQQFLETVAELAASALQRIRVDQAERTARAELHVSESRLARLSESGALGVAEATESHIVSANRAMLDMLGYDELPPGGLDWRKITPPQWADADEQALAELTTSGFMKPFEKEYYRADGTTIPVLLSSAVYRTDPIGVVVTAVDLRERRDLERRERETLLERDRLSRAVQAALFPRLRVDDAPWEVEVAYRPGDQRMALGGDFYDALTLPDGRLAVAIGDVTGHGPSAAAAGSALRAAWRTLVISGHRLDDLPARLHDLLESEREDDFLLATLLALMLEGEGQVEAVSMGHPPPLLLGAGGVREVSLPRNPILGLAPPRDPAVSRFRLATDDRLLLYTDGLIEGYAAPGSRQRLELDGLEALLAGVGAGARVRPEALIEAAQAKNGAGLPDDVAVMIIRPTG